MDYISTVCNILSTIEKTMDDEQFDTQTLTAERFGISEWLWVHIMDDLNKNEYIGGVEKEFDPVKLAGVLNVYRPYLTLKGAKLLSKYVGW